MLTRSHYIHKYVHTIYFIFFNIKLTCMVPTLDFSVRIKTNNDSKTKQYIVYG